MLKLKIKKNAQVAMEFVILVGISFGALIVFTIFVGDNLTSVQQETDYFKLKDLALATKSEISLAAKLEDGYQRSLYVPLTIDGLEYNISQNGNYILFQSVDAEYQIIVPNYQGNLEKGHNIIRKIDGAIEVNT